MALRRAGARAVPHGRGRCGAAGAQPARHGARSDWTTTAYSSCAARPVWPPRAGARAAREQHAAPPRVRARARRRRRLLRARPAARVPSLAGELPLAEGTWELFTRARDGKRVPVMLDAALHSRLPAETVVALKPFSLAMTPDGRAVLGVRRDLANEERGRFQTRRLRDAVYGGGQTEPLREAVVYASFRGRQYSDSPRAIHEELVRRGAPLEHLWTVLDGQCRVPDTATARARRQPRAVGGDGACPLHRGQRPLPGVVRPPARPDVPADLARHAAQAARVRRLRGVRTDAALRAPAGRSRSATGSTCSRPTASRPRSCAAPTPSRARCSRPATRATTCSPGPTAARSCAAGSGSRRACAWCSTRRPTATRCATTAAATGSTRSSTSSACGPPPGRTRSCCTASTTTSSIPCPGPPTASCATCPTSRTGPSSCSPPTCC